ncbi:hypothetical protein Esi_0204_0058 [Ectocarpus siliculosus]|uniref:Uncharacterized protein n=1 Tax=Ectocarpus siliculosus TaxID=2880 RepID=D7FQM5_ECTSI|nr:hypothetical protein Esi_0204_0058 [Ectocarpus siliculosus]|eukprot:CBJ30620.1 hypothetical protein Esi_0204_0058 [Ectocarpus siliculosus]
MVSKTADTPERQGSLGFKGVSQRTSHPCSLCKVKQTADADDVGGQLGERDYDVVKNRRTRRECEHGRSKLLEMGFGTGEAVKLSKELGIVEPHPTLLGHPRALWDLTSMHSPMVCVGPELLRLNNLNHLGQSQTFLLDLLSPAGREHVAGIFRQGCTLLGAGVSPLKKPVKDYPGYTGAQKALFGSVQLIVLRGLLLSTATMKHYLNSTALKKYNGEIWGHVSPEEARDRVLEYFQASSSLSFAANGQEFTDFDLLQLHTRAGDYVENAKLILGRAGIRTSNHTWLHFADSIKAHGRPQNADVSEGGHQHHKKHNKSGSSRDPPAHHARSTNTKLALMRSATSETYTATRFSYSKKTMITETVTSGPGCQRVLQALDDSLSGGIANVVDGTEGTKPTAAKLAGQPHGTATWRATILRQDAAPNDVRAGSAGGGVAPDDVGGGSAGGGGVREAWEACLSKGAVRPSAGAILNANTLWYACGRSDGDGRDVCKELRCSSCWEGGGKSLKNDEIICHRIKHGVPAKISSGLGRFKGGDVKAATAGGATPRDWAVGSGQGDAVESFTNPMAKRDDLSGDGHVTLARILYFFDHEGNRRPDSIPGAGPAMEFVLAYEFVTCGSGRSKKADSVTQHPTYWLQGGVKQVPSVYPIEAIRTHVMMYHHCPASSFATGVSHTPAPDSCGLHADDRARGGGKVWKHHYRLAAANPSGPRDAYMLSEHWRGSFQDGVG